GRGAGHARFGQIEPPRRAAPRRAGRVRRSRGAPRAAARPLTARLYHGWVIVGGAFVVLLLAYGTQYAFGVFFAALLAEFRWSPPSLSGAFSLYAFVYSALGLVAGRLTDRWGPRVVIGAGGVLLGAGPRGLERGHARWQA